MQDFQQLLQKSMQNHKHLCPRQVLGVRLGLMGLLTLQLEPNRDDKRLLIITETDGCFVDGLITATGCAIGHRTLRLEDYGKTAAAFIDTHTRRAVRITPLPDLRQRAALFLPAEPTHYLAQLKAYQHMPNCDMFTVQEIHLTTPVESLVSRPGMRVTCQRCGEEIMNERETHHNDQILCQPCARLASCYYHPAETTPITAPQRPEQTQ